MTIQPGDQAPNFTAKVTDGETVDEFELSEHLGDGPVVIGFFPLAFTSVCENQMTDLKENLETLQAEGATVFGLSVDSPFALQAFHQENNFGFPLISDYNREAVDAFGLFYEDLMGLEKPAKRSTVILNENGDVAWTWTTDDPGQKPDIETVKSVVQKVAAGQSPQNEAT